MNRALITDAVRLFGRIHSAIVEVDRARGSRGAFASLAQRARWQRLTDLRTRAFRRWVRRGGHLVEPEL